MTLFDRVLAIASLITATLILGGGFIAARFYFEVGGTPADVTLLRYGTAAVLLLPIAWKVASTIGVLRSFVLAICGGASFGGLVFVGMTGAPIAHGSAIVPGLGLIAGTFGGAVFLNEALPKLKLAGLAIGLGGLLLLVGPTVVSADGGALWAELCYVAAGLLWATFTVALKAWAVRPLHGAALASVFSVPLLIAMSFVADLNIHNVPIWDTAGQALYQGVVFAIGGIVLYAFAVGKLGAGTSVAAMPLLPLFATLLDWALFDGPLTTTTLVAFGVMVISVFLIAAAMRGSSTAFSERATISK
ncbi:MAG: DMT family transporter [Pseudomonadota bacterium]